MSVKHPSSWRYGKRSPEKEHYYSTNMKQMRKCIMFSRFIVFVLLRIKVRKLQKMRASWIFQLGPQISKTTIRPHLHSNYWFQKIRNFQKVLGTRLNSYFTFHLGKHLPHAKHHQKLTFSHHLAKKFKTAAHKFIEVATSAQTKTQ